MDTGVVRREAGALCGSGTGSAKMPPGNGRGSGVRTPDMSPPGPPGQILDRVPVRAVHSL